MTSLEVGAELAPRTEPEISRTTLALFAGASGDHNPIHIDIDVARTAGLEDVFAQGMLSMAYLGRLLTANFPQASIRSYGVRFAAVTPLHSVPNCTARVVAVDGDETTLDLVVSLADGTTTLTGHAVIDTRA
ncbi:MaoC/PaaZ C-terminal domain-containing protein [Nocardioides sp. NPDC059952]|uniref:MaoC/PaaZ C-terminal domain-containing protein n=1 Tax=Nocardioides sp. NPDC059952 TaxID=3347014 RepID=UPI00364C739B